MDSEANDPYDELELAGAPAANMPLAGMGSSPPGGMGVTSQGFGQEGYVLNDLEELVKPPPEEQNFATGVPYYLLAASIRHPLPG